MAVTGNISQESRPARGAWVEISVDVIGTSAATSRPARGAWVEILLLDRLVFDNAVAPRKGRVG